jgi:DNA-directed RNA polymerase subunit H (RpoH/RPB5)
MDNQINKTVYEMFEQRGYTITHEDYGEDEDCGNGEEGGVKQNYLKGTTNHGTNIVVFLNVIGKFNVCNFSSVVGILNKMNVNHCIIIYDVITSAVKKLIDNISYLQLKDIKTIQHKIGNFINLKIELFESRQLRYNITKHELVPKHIRLSDEEALPFKKEKYPILKHDDPVAKFYGFEKNNIIKIIRSGGYICYRIVK